jgi:hypothetical protein
MHMRFPRFHFGAAIAMGLSMLCMSTVPVFADGVSAPTVSAVVDGNTIMLSWTIPPGAVSFVIRRSTSGFPASTSDGVLVATPDGAVSSYNDTALLDGTYYYSVFAFNGASYSVGGHPSVMTVDTVAPSSPEDFAVDISGSDIHLSWVNPTDEDFESVYIFGSTSAYIETTDIGGAVVTGLAYTSWDVDNLADSVYYYTIFAKDTHGNYSSPTYLTFTIDTTPTTAPSDFTASVQGDDVILAWTNPVDADFASVSIRRSAVTYPATSTSDTGIVSGSTATSLVDDDLDDATYYYSMFAVDGAGNVSLAATASAVVPSRAPSNTNQSPGGSGGRARSALNRISGTPAHPAATNAKPTESADVRHIDLTTAMQRRTCHRVQKEFRGKALDRVNARLRKRLGFTCA